MDNVRIVQRSAHSSTVQVYNAQVLVKCVHRTYYQVECNIVTAIGLVPCEKSPSHLCWHIKRAMELVLGADVNRPSVVHDDTVTWFERRVPALWMWAGNSEPMTLVHVESKQGQKVIAHGWAVVRGIVGRELVSESQIGECKVSVYIQSKGA